MCVPSSLSYDQPLTFRFQAEPEIDAHATISDTPKETTNIKHTVVSNVHRGVSNADAIVPDVCHNVSSAHPIISDAVNAPATVYRERKSRNGQNGQNQAVSAARALTFTEYPSTTA